MNNQQLVEFDKDYTILINEHEHMNTTYNATYSYYMAMNINFNIFKQNRNMLNIKFTEDKRN